MVKTINYPYLPKGKKILFVDESNEFIQMAKAYALIHSLDHGHRTASVIVKDGKVLGLGANGSDYHDKYGCERKKLGIPTGQRYELCEGCHPKNHSERRAIEDTKGKNNDPTGADLYLWGHWWCCRPCWDVMIAAGIKKVFLLKDSHRLFGR